ncbi:hypothetical protein DUI87_20191 [Hirundo rustica rustica]|uniref:DUF1736 domain-containing protein n=1 Tax=Hirundo rustica rustica TaxID=333673 RepID=A0A3M0JPP9_HIRRU|nr:hypothetical protein DUI87_20191 [Hirundo rustica rustica]
MVTGSARGSRSRDRAAPAPCPSAGGRRGGPAAAAVLAGLCALCYGNSLRGEFVHDDVWAIVNNPDVRAAAPVSAAFANDFWGKRMAENTSHKSYRPLCVLTFKLNILLAGMNPFYFHAVNVILHCLVTLVLMYTCDKAVFKDCRLAFVTALFFAVHPIHTEAVTGIVGRADVLACLLFLLAFLSYNRSVDQLYVGEHFPPTASPFFLLLSLFLGTCAMLVKETGVTVFGVCLVYDFFSLSCNGLKLRNGGIHQRPARLPVSSPCGSPQVPLSGRENGKQRFGHRGAWSSCHPASPPGQRSGGLAVPSRAVWAICRHCYGLFDIIHFAIVKVKSSKLLMGSMTMVFTFLESPWVILVLYFRLWIMGGSMPMFSEQDNPASFSPYILTRFLTYSYLLAFNAWLLLAPITLCYDWQVGSIPLVESIWDVRNLATVFLVLVMTLLSLHCIAAFKKLEHKEVLVGLLFLVFPFIPASNLFFRVGFVVAERVLYMPSTQTRGCSGSERPIIRDAPDHFPFDRNRLERTLRGLVQIPMASKASCLGPGSDRATAELTTLEALPGKLPSSSECSLTCTGSFQQGTTAWAAAGLIKVRGASKGSSESCMGYCILFVHGLKKLSMWLNKWRITVPTLFALLLLLFSWKTVKQNEIWLSRESLFSSGVRTLPHNAKVHYNYANFLKDQGRNIEAIYHYKTALKQTDPFCRAWGCVGAQQPLLAYFDGCVEAVEKLLGVGQAASGGYSGRPYTVQGAVQVFSLEREERVDQEAEKPVWKRLVL